MRKLQLIALALGAVSVVSGAARTSAADGNWNSTSSWTGGVVPGDGDTVTITHNITVTADATVGNSPADTAGATPTLPVIALQRNKSGSFCTDSENPTVHGTLTVNSGVTFTVRGSVSVTGTLYYCSPIITIQPGSTWTFDNSAAPSNGAGVYRIYATQVRSLTYINAQGTGWGAGQYVTINGKLPSCSTCVQAVWTNELTSPIAGGTFDTFKHNYNFVKFWYFGSTTDAYRSIYVQCNSEGYTITPQLFMTNVEWHNSTGFAGGYPCANMDFKMESIKVVNSVGSNGFFWVSPTTTAIAGGRSRTAKYIYVDKGSYMTSAGINFNNFQAVSYVVLDGQKNTFGPLSSSNPALMPSIDHLLVRQAALSGAGDTTSLGDTYYSLWVVDGGLGNVHTINTVTFTSGTHNWIIDHHVWQHGDATGSSDTDGPVFRPLGAGANTFTASYNYLLILPCAAQPTYTCHTLPLGPYNATTSNTWNHTVMPFGTNYSSSIALIGTAYYGEVDNGIAGALSLKNSILWNANASGGRSPIGIHGSSGYCSDLHLNNCVANTFDPTKIHNNLVWNYGTVSNRWTSAVTGCGGVNCTSYGTPYDFPMTGTAPGLHDLWGTTSSNPQNAPNFVWQQQGLTAPGPRDWAHTRFGADITTGETATEVHFATTFQVFAAADPGDLTTTAGLKGRIDDMFS
jgi:hypothetical protein